MTKIQNLALFMMLSASAVYGSENVKGDPKISDRAFGVEDLHRMTDEISPEVRARLAKLLLSTLEERTPEARERRAAASLFCEGPSDNLNPLNEIIPPDSTSIPWTPSSTSFVRKPLGINDKMPVEMTKRRERGIFGEPEKKP